MVIVLSIYKVESWGKIGDVSSGTSLFVVNRIISSLECNNSVVKGEAFIPEFSLSSGNEHIVSALWEFL